MRQLKKFTPLLFSMSISLMAISFPLTAADNGQHKETQKSGQASGNTSQQQSQQKSGADNDQQHRLSPDHHQSDYGSYKESDSKVDHHDTRDHEDAMH